MAWWPGGRGGRAAAAAAVGDVWVLNLLTWDTSRTGESWSRFGQLGFDRPGVPGWYVGHLLPGDHVTYADLSAHRGPAG